jgi:hypothetical protein
MNLDNKFKAVLEYLETPNTNYHAGDKQIIYLTFESENTLEVKKNLNTWMALARGYEFEIEKVSMARTINSFLRDNPRRKGWHIPDTENVFDEIVDFFKIDIGSIIVENHVIEKEIFAAQERLSGKAKPLIIITDLEAIHPFTRFGPIEQKVYTEISVPILVLYPGTLSGSSLEFFGFYPPDGNYRSKHF